MEPILKACFGNAEESRRALDECADIDPEGIDPATRRLLPILYARSASADRSALMELAHRAYLTTWRQNHERMVQVAATVASFRAVGIDCMLLKGAALTLRHYRDYGVRTMGDFDLLIHHEHLEGAVQVLLENGWAAEDGCGVASIMRQARVRHAWQFSRGVTESCDLHWRPLAHCYSPRIAEMFWDGAEAVGVAGEQLKVPCPTGQFFHVCVHAMHWEWTPNMYWVADALTVLAGGEVDWDRAAVLAANAGMRVRFARALFVLASQFHADVPGRLLDVPGTGWEQREFALLQKPCPLGYLDSVAWHRYHFRRLRPFDPRWRTLPAFVGFPQYLAAFLDAETWPAALQKLWPQLKLRAVRH